MSPSKHPKKGKRAPRRRTQEIVSTDIPALIVPDDRDDNRDDGVPPFALAGSKGGAANWVIAIVVVVVLGAVICWFITRVPL